MNLLFLSLATTNQIHPPSVVLLEVVVIIAAICTLFIRRRHRKDAWVGTVTKVYDRLPQSMPKLASGIIWIQKDDGSKLQFMLSPNAKRQQVPKVGDRMRKVAGHNQPEIIEAS